MNPIYWLIAKEQYRHLSHHFILKIENKFMVFTTTNKELIGIKKHFISNQNIQGEEKIQYLFEKIHHIDYNTMNITIAEKGAMFYCNHQATLQPFIEKLQ